MEVLAVEFSKLHILKLWVEFPVLVKDMVVSLCEFEDSTYKYKFLALRVVLSKVTMRSETGLFVKLSD